MITDSRIKVELWVTLGKWVGKGPLKTIVYTGTYNNQIFSISPFGSYRTYPDYDRRQKDFLVKKIQLRILKNDMDWRGLQQLKHPNVVRYISIKNKREIVQPSVVYIIQDYFQEQTLTKFIEKMCPIITENSSFVLKSAVRQIASGLKYLHDRGIIHGNLKPSNVLVRPPLYEPNGFVLTDYAYTDYRSYPPAKARRDCPLKDNPEITKWMAPELLVPLRSQGEILLKNKAAPHAASPVIKRKTTQDVSSMADVYSFGKILGSMFKKATWLDKVDGIFCKLLVEQMTITDPIYRISCETILERHPFLVVQPKCGRMADARIDHIIELSPIKFF